MSINNKRSYTEYTITQPTTDFAIGFDDFDEGSKDSILVTLNGVLVETLGYAAIRKNESTVSITPAITEGTVRLTRETDIDEPFHKFTAGALFSAKSMDENFQQVRHSQQEVRDGFVFLEYNTNGIVQASKEATTQAKAATVEATASAVRAESAADTAVQAVGSLQGVVNAATTATTNANTATATANTAASQATAATTSAQNAALAASVAKQEAITATANANAATVDTLAATGRANDAADIVADLVVGKVRAQDVSTVGGSNQEEFNTVVTTKLARQYVSDVSSLKALMNNTVGEVIYVVSAGTNYTFKITTNLPINDGTVIQGVGGVWEMEIQSSYYASMFCPASSIDNVNEPQEDNINAGILYATAKGRPFIIDKPYYVDSKIARTTQTFPALNGFRDSSSNFAIRIQSNSILAFQHEGELKLKPTTAAYGAILMVFDVENYIILDPKLTGDRDTHLVTTGEQHHGIHLAASKNGYIRNPVIKETWGDGIYLGFMFWVKPFIDVYVPTNVVIDNPRLLKISRNGVSLCGAENLTINNLYVEEADRVPPLAGVDIEPEEDINYTEKMFIKNVVFHNSTFIGCGYALSQNIFGNRHVEVSFTGTTLIKNVGAKSSWIPMLLGSKWLEDNTELNYKQEGYLIIDHVIVSDIGSDMAFKYLVQVDIPENSIKVRIKHYEFTSTNIIPKLMFINTGVVSPKSSGFSVDKFTFNNQVNYVDFEFSAPDTAKPKINYNLNFDESLNIQYQNKGFEFYGSCYIGGWALVSTPLWDEKSHINNVLFTPSDNGSGAKTSHGTVTNKDRELFYSLSPKGSEHALGLSVISTGFVKRSTTDGASIRLVDMSYPAGTKIKSIYGNWIS